MRYFLIGFMGCGKSTVGHNLARAKSMKYTDLDKYIEQKEGLTVQSIFAEQGEAAFRKLEAKYLREIIANNSDIVVSTGGGVPCFEDNMALMNASGRTIYLKMEVEALADRLENAKFVRPLIAGKSGTELRKYIEETLSKREFYYNQATIIYGNPTRDISKMLEVLSYYN